jgi:hypothetical protein
VATRMRAAVRKRLREHGSTGLRMPRAGVVVRGAITALSLL